MPTPTKPSTRISDLRNLGPKSQAMLAKIGVRTLAQVRDKGAVPTYVMAKRVDKSVSLNLLYALVGAIENRPWRDIRWERKLELLSAIQECDRQYPVQSTQQPDELSQLRNIGKAMRQDFDLLGITSVKQLAKCNADKLYARIQTLTGARHDPCVWDTYAAAIHQAKTGEALPWWNFTKIRKGREGGNL